MNYSTDIDYLGIVGPCCVSSIETPEDVQKTYNDTSNYNLVMCKAAPSATVQAFMSRVPDNTGKMTASYNLLTKALVVMASRS